MRVVNPIPVIPQHVRRELGRKAADRALRRARASDALARAEAKRNRKNAKRAATGATA